MVPQVGPAGAVPQVPKDAWSRRWSRRWVPHAVDCLRRPGGNIRRKVLPPAPLSKDFLAGMLSGTTIKKFRKGFWGITLFKGFPPIADRWHKNYTLVRGPREPNVSETGCAQRSSERSERQLHFFRMSPASPAACIWCRLSDSARRATTTATITAYERRR